MYPPAPAQYPLPIARALEAADRSCPGDDPAACHNAVMRLASATIYYLAAIAVAQYTQALYTGAAEADPTLNRSLRSLRRVLPGQWLGWTARALEAAPDGPVAGFAGWYSAAQPGPLAGAYEALRRVMVDNLGYTGEYGPRGEVSPRVLLELIDQYRVRRGKADAASITPAVDTAAGNALLPGLHALLESAPFLGDYMLYAPNQRQVLMGREAVTPMPPIFPPEDVEATLLLYPPGALPDYTKRPDPNQERLPLFPLDPLLVYLHCPQCDRYRVFALKEVAGGTPSYLGLDPDCGHIV